MNNNKTKARVIAYYLPQFHPIPENDETWGKGFTEWTNVAKAKPLFPGHYQPRIPADLGFYDLRLPQVREAQAEMARDAGVEGFMYWHYWFGNGKMLLEKPLEEVVESGKPDFPFCYGWANHSWSTKTWTNNGRVSKNKMIAEQLYPGHEDNVAHFNYCLKAFKDKRYITVDGKPLFVIFDAPSFVGMKEFIDEWQELARQNGLSGIYFVGQWTTLTPLDTFWEQGFDGVICSGRQIAEKRAAGSGLIRKIRDILSYKFGLPTMIFDYSKIMKYMEFEENRLPNCFPKIIPGYDRTARAGFKGQIYKNATPEAFGKNIERTLTYIMDKDYEHRLIFLDSWNEWGEGNYMEPDQKWGHAFLDALKAKIVEK